MEVPRNLRYNHNYNFTGAWVMDPALWEDTRSRATTPDPLLPAALITPPPPQSPSPSSPSTPPPSPLVPMVPLPEFVEGSSSRPLEEEVGGWSSADTGSHSWPIVEGGVWGEGDVNAMDVDDESDMEDGSSWGCPTCGE